MSKKTKKEVEQVIGGAFMMSLMSTLLNSKMDQAIIENEMAKHSKMIMGLLESCQNLTYRSEVPDYSSLRKEAAPGP